MKKVILNAPTLLNILGYKNLLFSQVVSAFNNVFLLGMSYFFTNIFEVYSELRRDTSAPKQVGLSFKF